jgi:hypothetical protein
MLLNTIGKKSAKAASPFFFTQYGKFDNLKFQAYILVTQSITKKIKMCTKKISACKTPV